MNKFFKTTLLAICATGILSTGVQANPAFKAFGELCTDFVNVANGNLKTSYELPATISTVEQWKAAITDATSSLAESVTLRFDNFNEDEYSISLITDYNRSIKAEGTTRTDGTAKITYSFTYSPNYRILRAYEDSNLLSVLTGDELAALTRAYAIKDKIITNDMTDYEKELAIHDYIIKNYSYNVAAVENEDDNTLRTHSITGMLLDGNGVCEAYSNTFMLLCRMSGLECHLATGTVDGMKHQWNIVKLNNEYYNVDLTSDDPVPDKAGRVYYTHFNLTDSEISKTHTIDKENIKCTGQRYNYYSYNNLNVSSDEDLRILLNDKLNRGQREITFKTVGGYILDNSQPLQQIAQERELYNISISGEYGKEGIFTVFFS